MFKKTFIFTRKQSIPFLMLLIFLLFLQSFTELTLLWIVLACYLITTLLLMDVWIIYGVTKETIDKALAQAGEEGPKIQYYGIKKISIIIFHLPIKSPKIRFIKKFKKILESQKSY